MVFFRIFLFVRIFSLDSFNSSNKVRVVGVLISLLLKAVLLGYRSTGLPLEWK
jgi:hypothetical protein